MIKKTSGSERFQQWLGMAKYLREALTRGHRRYLVGSVAVHLLVVVLMTWSWSSTEAVKTYVIPQSIEARVLTAEEVDRLPYKKKQRMEQEALKKKRQDDLKKKKQAQKKQELAKKKAEQERVRKAAAKKEAERKKLLAAKKQQQVEKDRAEQKAREEKAKEQLAKTEKERREKAKQQEQAQKEVEKLKRLAEAREQTLREQRMAERLKGIEDLKSAEQTDEPIFDVDEKTRYLSIIRNRIEKAWHKPPNSEGSSVLLRIELFPSGELSSAAIINSSGNSALDESALRAVRAVNKFEVPAEQAFFEKYFRSFQMSFKPSD